MIGFVRNTMRPRWWAGMLPLRLEWGLFVLIFLPQVAAQEMPRPLPPVRPAAGGAEASPPPEEPIPAPQANRPAALGKGTAAEEVEPKKAEPKKVEPEPAWYSPGYWWRVEGWDNSFEVGISGAAGNAETFDFRAGTDWKRKWERVDVAWSIVYAKSQNRSTETKHNALFNGRSDMNFGDSPWSWFMKTDLEYDEFKAFNLRWVVNSGLSYRWFQRKDLTLSSRFGAGVSREFGGPDDTWVPEAVFGASYEHQWTRHQKFSLNADYYPDWGDFLSYRFVGKASWELLLDEASNMSLKLSVIDRYDSTPHGRRPNDIDYALLLLWKF